MNLSQKQQLEEELRSAGATKKDLKSLTNIASRLEYLKSPVQTAKSPNRHGQFKVRRLAYTIGITTAFSVAVVVFLVVGSQTVLPGSYLYPVQKTSDSMAEYIDSSYRVTVMMRTADQVRELVSLHAPTRIVSQTLSEYQNQAANNKSTSDNYSAFEYCKQRLEEAADKAPPAMRQKIENTLQSLNDV